jgi:hypothetical protein
VKRKCPLCTIWKATMYCGQKSGENRIKFMTKCPKKKK